MAKNNIELSIGSNFNGEGFTRLDSALKRSAGNVGKATRSVSKVVDALAGMDGKLGKTAGMVGELSSQFLSGGVFGLALAAASVAVGKLVEHFQKMKHAVAEAADYMRTELLSALGNVDAKTNKVIAGMARENTKITRQLARDNQGADEIGRATNAVDAYGKISANNSKAAEAARKGVEEARANLKKAQEQAAQYIIEKKKAEDYLANISETAFLADPSEKKRRLTEARARVKKVEDDFAADAKILKSATDALAKAEERLTSLQDAESESALDLEQAKKNLASIREKEAKAAEEREAKEKRAHEEMMLALEEKMRIETEAAEEAQKLSQQRVNDAKKRAEIEKKLEDKRVETAKKVAELDKKIAAAKEEALRLEEEASRARGGKTFNEWQRGEKERDREEEKAAKKQKKVVDLAKRERDQLEDRVFDRDGKIRKSANAQDIAKLEKLNEFINNQDPNNNPALKDAEKLEMEKKAALENTAKDIEKIAKALKDGGVNI